ncbi:MAG TPA: helix-turn-helix domain-containing protein [Mycobacteriales bacterium]|nr:helix-turn-helix domain-containing protein [Mycobacteriales bacterium]
MTTAAAAQSVRRHLTTRQLDTVERVLEAAVDEVAETGYEGFTVRGAARRAGVAPATAYTYFSSKEHLIAEVFALRMRTMPPTRLDRRRPAAERVATVVRDIVGVVADRPQLWEATTAALTASQPDVLHVRERVGADMLQRLVAALGEDADPSVLTTLTMMWAGAMLLVGTGHLPFDQLADRVADATRLIVKGAHS